LVLGSELFLCCRYTTGAGNGRSLTIDQQRIKHSPGNVPGFCFAKTESLNVPFWPLAQTITSPARRANIGRLPRGIRPVEGLISCAPCWCRAPATRSRSRRADGSCLRDPFRNPTRARDARPESRQAAWWRSVGLNPVARLQLPTEFVQEAKSYRRIRLGRHYRIRDPLTSRLPTASGILAGLPSHSMVAPFFCLAVLPLGPTDQGHCSQL
jgi:hypothetical protein